MATRADLLVQYRVRNILLTALATLPPWVRMGPTCRKCGRALITDESQSIGKCVVCRG